MSKQPVACCRDRSFVMGKPKKDTLYNKYCLSNAFFFSSKQMKITYQRFTKQKVVVALFLSYNLNIQEMNEVIAFLHTKAWQTY